MGLWTAIIMLTATVGGLAAFGLSSSGLSEVKSIIPAVLASMISAIILGLGILGTTDAGLLLLFVVVAMAAPVAGASSALGVWLGRKAR